MFLSGLFNTFGYKGIPLSASLRYEDGTVTKPYWTSAIGAGRVEQSFFAYPEGYKITGDQASLVLSKARTKQVDAILDSLLDEEQTSTKH